MKAWMATLATVAASVAATGMVLMTGAAQARDVDWTVTIGSPRPVYAPPRVIYTPPPVVHAPVVVYHPAPVVYMPAPVYHAPAPVVYVPYGHAKKWHKKQYKYAGYPGAVYKVKGKGHHKHHDA